MYSASHAIIVVTIAVGLAAVLGTPGQAQTTAEAMTAAAAPTLDLSSKPTIAIQAAKAAQVAKTTPGPAVDTVEPVTVRPEAPAQARVVASTEATSLTSPNFSARDVQEPMLAVSAGRNTAAGAQSVDNTFAGGFLKVNPQGGATRTDVGLTRVF